ACGAYAFRQPIRSTLLPCKPRSIHGARKEARAALKFAGCNACSASHSHNHPGNLMAVVSVANLVLAYGDRHVLDGANLTLSETEHVGLVGRNGSGKSTLLKLIAGVGNLKHDSGQVQVTRGATVGYL